ncbi:S-layer homology domain-containing protein, partial [Paenibacillus endoradicis]|uniref:S-layer homology domain-containing protein n=1 Tax=Paenibacillus endoradicis TaxID=2972487 RepID=UPI00215942D7
SHVFEILKNFPENFSKPATLTFMFDPNKVGSDQRPGVFYYDELTKQWIEITGGTVNGNRITVSVKHFTKFAVLVVGQSVDVPTDALKFSDIAGHWAKDNIIQAVDKGIVTGYSNGTFQPERNVTRAEFVVMLMNTLKLEGKATDLTFTDSAEIGDWAKGAVAKALEASIILGDSEGSFRPQAEITRAEMAVMIARAMELVTEENAVTDFADDQVIPMWARGAVAAMKELGLIEGKGNNRYDGNGMTTRAEAVTVLLKVLAQQQ